MESLQQELSELKSHLIMGIRTFDRVIAVMNSLFSDDNNSENKEKEEENKKDENI